MKLTDKELYCIALAIESHLNKRDVYWTKQSRANFNRMTKKVIEEGMTRKNKESILNPILDFEDSE